MTTLRPDMEAQQRARFAMQALVDALDQLEMVADDVMLNGAQIETLEEANTRLALLCPRMKMRRSMLHLTSEFGRAP